MEQHLVLVINPGSTSTKVALFKGNEKVEQESISYDQETLRQYQSIIHQFKFRKDAVIEWIREKGYSLNSLDAVVGRGGLLRSMPSGTYEVGEQMIADLEKGVQGEHASNLGGLIASAIAKQAGVKAYIVDPVAVDELEPVARISGMPDIERKSLSHALNIRAIARAYATSKQKKLEEMSIIVAHIGGGISIVPMKNGKMIDTNNANEMGPFSPERAGGLPVGDVVKLCYSGEYDASSFKTLIRGQGGLISYIGTNDLRKAKEMIESANGVAAEAVSAMAYQIAKEIGAMATVLKGEVEAILLTGGAAYDDYLTTRIIEMVQFIAPVVVLAGEDEMEALNLGAQRILAGEEKAKNYKEVVCHD